jgi:sulfate adenylyltransferase subunit 1
MDDTREIGRAGLLRFITAGSVDDGKSTLIGRLLYDSKGLLADQLTAIEAASRRRGMESIDLSLLTDGLLAEREQGITIDVAYRYFSTPARKFIIGDSPGHAQYTRNMITAASTADVAVLLVDARYGLREQTRRHAYVARWVGIKRVVLAVNKMDLVGHERAVFEDIAKAFESFAVGLGFDEIREIPVSALRGDNVVEHGDQMSWYNGPTLLQYLETVPARHDSDAGQLRFPVQRVVRIASGNAQPGATYEDGGFRGYQGTVASGQVSVGDEIVVLPGGHTAKVSRIVTAGGELDVAIEEMAITLQLDAEIDISRGDLIAEARSAPVPRREFEAELCWFDTEPLDPARPYLVKQGAATVRANFSRLRHRVDVDTLTHHADPHALAMNDIASVQLRTQRPLAFDPYRDNRVTGAFIVIDESSNRTVAAGTIQ